MKNTEEKSLQVFTKGPFTWERQPGETDKSYAAFCVYRDMVLNERSLEATGRKQNIKNIRHYADWSKKFGWVERSRAYDAYVQIHSRKLREEEHIKNIEEFSERQRLIAKETIQTAVMILKKANTRLAKLNAKDIHPASLPGFYRAAAALFEAGSSAESAALGIEQLLEAFEQFKQR